MNVKIQQFKNTSGQLVKIKLEDNQILVHHSDCTQHYIPLHELFYNYKLSQDEVVAIYNMIQRLKRDDLGREQLLNYNPN